MMSDLIVAQRERELMNGKGPVEEPSEAHVEEKGFVWPFPATETNPHPGIALNEHKSALFSPLKIRGVTFKNRLGVAPMCQYSAENGLPTDWHLQELGSYAVGGVGLILAEATAVVPEGRITPQCAGIWSDEHVPAWRRIVDFVHAHGTPIGLQIAHAGRKASTLAPFLSGSKTRNMATVEEGGWPDGVVGPSALAWGPTFYTPHELTKDELKDLMQAFVDAAKRADRAGFDFLEVHGAHGYLISSFLSPLANKRTDEYGGSLENRMRWPLETVKAVRAAWPEHKPLFVRISATDWTEAGWTADDSVVLGKRLKELGVDVVDCSTGGNGTLRPDVIKGFYKAGYQAPFARRVKQEAGVMTAAVGRIETSALAEQLVADGSADIILVGRQFLRNPYWTRDVARELGVDLTWAPQHTMAKRPLTTPDVAPVVHVPDESA